MAKSIVQLERLHKDAIRNGTEAVLPTLQRVHRLTVGIYSEALLRKIATDPTGFNERERESIWRVQAQVDRWSHVVDLAFRRQYKVLLHLPLDAASLGDTVHAQYERVQSLLKTRLQATIEDRNKVAHGQWVWLLRSKKENDFRSDLPEALPNYSAVKAQFESIKKIGSLVHVLVVSEPTFQRDYTLLIQALESLDKKLGGSDYSGLVAQLQARRAEPPAR